MEDMWLYLIGLGVIVVAALALNGLSHKSTREF